MRNLKVLWLFVMVFSIPSISVAQDLSLGNLTEVDVDKLSDSQVEAFVKKAQDSGLTMEQLELLARQRGMPSAQVAKLRQRILEVQTGADEAGIQGNDYRLRESYQQEDKVSFFDDLMVGDSLEMPLPIFGSQIFKSAINFEPSPNTATPQNYILGPGDELIIDIYGASEITYNKTISPDGTILISRVGPIQVAGISVKSAKNRLKNKLSTIYSGLKGPQPNTFLEFSIGQIRSIKVNVVGNVERPGTYVLSSFSTAFNALFLAGGPNEYGSMRQIDVFRDGTKVATLDIYKYFFYGDLSGNPQLHDEDVLVVKSYQNKVTFAGEVKQPAIYEFLNEETYANLLEISGGAKASGFSQAITITRSFGNKSLKTFREEQASEVPLLDGDSIYIPRISENFANRVGIEGAVDQPGFYELNNDTKLSSIIRLAKPSRDAYMGRGNIIRLNNHLSLSNISFDLDKVLSGREDHELRNEDLIRVPSILDIEERKTVTLLGEVKNEGEYPFIEGMTVEDLVAISGGLKASANTTKVEVARRVSKDSKEFRTAILFDYSIGPDLALDSMTSSFVLEAFDLVTIKASALFRTQKIVKVEGEVLRPGFYVLETEKDKLTDILDRAGGLTSYAYPKGASLIRDLYSEAGKGDEGVRNLETTSTADGDFYRQRQLEGLIKRDSVEELDLSNTNKQGVGIQLDKALESPKSKYNLILQDGDIISIPKQLQTVRIRGEVLYSTRVSYDKTAGFKDYISLAGGFSDNAQIKKSYIIYANGRAKRTKNVLFFRVFPKVEPGADIFIPLKPVRNRVSVQEVLGLTSSLATIALIIDRLSN